LPVTIIQRDWSATGWIAAALLIYLVSLRPTPARGAEAVAPRDRTWSAQEKATILVAIASLLVAIMSFIRDLIAG
jgi:hypothetical protein